MAIHFTSSQEEQLQHLAAEAGRTPDEFAQQAMDHFIAYQKNYIAAVHEGIAAGERGELLDHEEVMSRMDEIIQNG